MNSILMLGGVVFAMACRDSGTGPGVGDALNGVLWSVSGEAVTAPMVVDSIVTVGLTDGRLVALQRSTGRSIWERRFDGPFRVEHLAKFGGLLIVPHRELHGIDAHTGAPRWSYGGEDLLPGGLITPPTLAGDTLFIVGLKDDLVASLDARTGIAHWRRPLGPVHLSPTVTADLVIYQVEWSARNGAIVALDRRSGQERWRYQHQVDSAFLASSAMSTVVGDDIVINLGIRLVALRLIDGTERWSTLPTASGFTGYHGAPLVSGEQFLLMASEGIIERFSVTSGSRIGSTPMPGAETLFGVSRILVPCGSHLCISFRRAWIVNPAGNVLWDSGERGPTFLSRITVDSTGTMFAGVRSTDGGAHIVAFRPPVQVGPTP